MHKKHAELLEKLNETSTRLFSLSLKETTEKQAYKVVCTYLREHLAKKRKEFKDACSKGKRKEVYYMSMEFLVGTSLRNNLCNIGAEEDFKKVLTQVKNNSEVDDDQETDNCEDGTCSI